MKQPCQKNCPNRNAECHTKCEKWLVYEKARNAEYERIGKEKSKDRVQDEMERDRKRDIALGRMKKRRNKNAFLRY